MSNFLVTCINRANNNLKTADSSGAFKCW